MITKGTLSCFIKEIQTRTCNDPVYKWTSGSWTNCDLGREGKPSLRFLCGKGTQTREVWYVVRRNG